MSVDGSGRIRRFSLLSFLLVTCSGFRSPYKNNNNHRRAMSSSSYGRGRLDRPQPRRYSNNRSESSAFLPLQVASEPDETTTADAERRQGLLVLITVPFAWGSFEPVVKFVYAIEPPIPGLVFSPCYYLVAAVALSVFSFAPSFRENNGKEEIEDGQSIMIVEDEEKSDIQQSKTTSDVGLASLPVLGGLELGSYLFLGNSLQVLGLKTVPANRVAFLIQLTTIFVPLVQGIAAKNLFSIPPRTWIACLVALGGVGVMSLEGNESALLQEGSNIENIGSSLLASQQLLSQGDLFVVGAALAYTFHCIRLEKYAKQTRAVTLAACKAISETTLSVLLVMGLLAYNSGNGGGSSPAVDGNFISSFAKESATEISGFLDVIPQKFADGDIPMSTLAPAVAAILWTGLITCGYTIYAQSFGQQRVSATTANLIYTAQPIWTALLAFIFLGETLGPSGYTGGAMIAIAVFLVISSEQPPSHHDTDIDSIATSEERRLLDSPEQNELELVECPSHPHKE